RDPILEYVRVFRYQIRTVRHDGGASRITAPRGIGDPYAAAIDQAFIAADRREDPKSGSGQVGLEAAVVRGSERAPAISAARSRLDVAHGDRDLSRCEGADAIPLLIGAAD